MHEQILDAVKAHVFILDMRLGSVTLKSYSAYTMTDIGCFCRSILDPTDSEQNAHRYSYLSPSGRTIKRRLRTGTGRLHFGQYSSVASNSLNMPLSFVWEAYDFNVPMKFFGSIVTPDKFCLDLPQQFCFLVTV